MKLNSSHHTLVVFALLTIAVTAFGYYILYGNTISQLKNSVQVLSDADIESEKKVHEQELIKVYNDTTEDRKKLLSFFVYEDSVVDFIEKVEGVGPDSGASLELSAINIDKDHLKTHADIKGTWSSVLKALTLIENLPYSLAIDNVFLDTSGGDTNSTVDADKKTAKAKNWHLVLDIKVLTSK